MSEIPEQLKEVVQQRFEEELKEKVKLIFFTQKMECQFCAETRTLLEVVAGWHDKITLDVFDFEDDKEKAQELGITKIPGLALVGEKDFGIRFFGIPSGYEFQTLIEGIILTSTGDSALPAAAVAELEKSAKNPANIQVFVIPTCPYCPLVATMAMQFAVANANVTAHVVELAEFPHLANKYNVIGTPKTVINETTEFEGVIPPAEFIHHIQKATLGSPTGISQTI